MSESHQRAELDAVFQTISQPHHGYNGYHETFVKEGQTGFGGMQINGKNYRYQQHQHPNPAGMPTFSNDNMSNNAMFDTHGMQRSARLSHYASGSPRNLDDYTARTPSGRKGLRQHDQQHAHDVDGFSFTNLPMIDNEHQATEEQIPEELRNVSIPPHELVLQERNEQRERPEHARYIYHFRTRVCEGYIHGNCPFDAYKCFDSHSDLPRRRRPVIQNGRYNYLPTRCRNFNDRGECTQNVYCRFAHTSDEVVCHPSKYKTQLCTFQVDSSNHCVGFGPHCAKAHSESELRVPLFEANDETLADGGGTEDDFVAPPSEQMMEHLYMQYFYKTLPCSGFPFNCNCNGLCYHRHEERRRGVIIRYSPIACPNVKPSSTSDWGNPQVDCSGKYCPRETIDGVLQPPKPSVTWDCEYAHTLLELMYHPSVYKTSECDHFQQHDPSTWTCLWRRRCAHAHGPSDLRPKEIAFEDFRRHLLSMQPSVETANALSRLAKLVLDDSHSPMRYLSESPINFGVSSALPPPPPYLRNQSTPADLALYHRSQHAVHISHRLSSQASSHSNVDEKIHTKPMLFTPSLWNTPLTSPTSNAGSIKATKPKAMASQCNWPPPSLMTRSSSQVVGGASKLDSRFSSWNPFLSPASAVTSDSDNAIESNLCPSNFTNHFGDGNTAQSPSCIPTSPRSPLSLILPSLTLPAIAVQNLLVCSVRGDHIVRDAVSSVCCGRILCRPCIPLFSASLGPTRACSCLRHFSKHNEHALSHSTTNPALLHLIELMYRQLEEQHLLPPSSTSTASSCS